MEIKALIKVLGICASPIKDSNTELLLNEALTSVQSADIETETISLRELEIQDCCQCNWCSTHQTADTLCRIRDDMADIYHRILGADAILVASPVYLARMPGRLASLLDRLRCTLYGKVYRGALKHKIGAGLAVSWYRNSGIETTLTTLHWAFLAFQMIVAVPGTLSIFGGGAVSSIGGSGEDDPDDKHLVARDRHGLRTARATAKEMIELARIMKKGECGSEVEIWADEKKGRCSKCGTIIKNRKLQPGDEKKANHVFKS